MIILIENKSFGNTWVKLCKEIMKSGSVMQTEYLNYAKYVTAVIHLDRRAVKEIEKLSLHLQFPTKKKHLEQYLQQFTDQFDVQDSQFEYTYYSRLKKQLSMLKERVDKIGSRRRVAITWIPALDIKHTHPPCLIYLNLFNRDGKKIDLSLHYRSRDCYNAWQSNLCGIVKMINDNVLNKPYRIENIIEVIDNAHVYNYNWKDVEKLRYIPDNPQERYY